MQNEYDSCLNYCSFAMAATEKTTFKAIPNFYNFLIAAL
jgi:hypothetical protein